MENGVYIVIYFTVPQTANPRIVWRMTSQFCRFANFGHDCVLDGPGIPEAEHIIHISLLVRPSGNHQKSDKFSV